MNHLLRNAGADPAPTSSGPPAATQWIIVAMGVAVAVLWYQFDVKKAKK